MSSLSSEQIATYPVTCGPKQLLAVLSNKLQCDCCDSCAFIVSKSISSLARLQHSHSILNSKQILLSTGTRSPYNKPKNIFGSFGLETHLYPTSALVPPELLTTKLLLSQSA